MNAKDYFDKFSLKLIKQEAVKWLTEENLSIAQIKGKLLSYECNSDEVTEIIEYLYTLQE